MKRTGAGIALSVVGLLVAPAAARSQAPNDHWANRTPVTVGTPGFVPEITEATVDASDPAIVCRIYGRAQGGNSVWFTYTTGDLTEYVNVSTADSSTPVTVAVYAGTPGSFGTVPGGCGDGPSASISGLRLEPRTTYSIELATPPGPVASGSATLRVDDAPIRQVTTTRDTTDAVCDIDCSLRDAIQAANVGGGAVLVPPGEYRLDAGSGDSAGDLDVHGAIGIYGAGASIVAPAQDRVMEADSHSGTVVISGLTLRDGDVTGNGGGLSVPSGAFVDLDGVSVENSRASGDGGGVYAGGRGRLVRSAITGSVADEGGGLVLGGENLPFEVRDSTLANNTGSFIAGGILSQADLAVVSSTVSGNGGGGLINGYEATMTVRSVTVTGNTSPNNFFPRAGGLLSFPGGTVDVRNSVFAGNGSDADCSPGPYTISYSQIVDPGECDVSGTGNATGGNPGLLPLADNGGPTRTQRVPLGSSLLDRGDPADCRDGDGVALATDQRGLPRVVNGDAVPGARCDIGAVEKPNEAPACAAPGATTAEDTELPLAPCTDPEGLSLTYDGLSAAHGVFDGAIYRPSLNYNGPDTLAFVAHDDANPGVAGTVNVTVAPINDAPVAFDDAMAATEAGAPGVLANDSDAEGDALIAQLVTQPAHGTLLLAADGAYRYVPALGFSGTDSFTYVARDGSARSAPATVTITVSPTPVPIKGAPPPPPGPAVSALAAAQRGRVLRFRLSAPARVSITLARGKRVVKRYTVRAGKAGLNALRVNVKRRRYSVAVTATDAGGRRSATVRRNLTLGR